MGRPAQVQKKQGSHLLSSIHSSVNEGTAWQTTLGCTGADTSLTCPGSLAGPRSNKAETGKHVRVASEEVDGCVWVADRSATSTSLTSRQHARNRTASGLPTGNPAQRRYSAEAARRSDSGRHANSSMVQDIPHRASEYLTRSGPPSPRKLLVYRSGEVRLGCRGLFWTWHGITL